MYKIFTPVCSVVIPVLNEEGNIEYITEKIINVFESLLTLWDNKFSYEIILVDDGSTDTTLQILKKLNKRNPTIKYISFSRNFGHQIALKAGLDHSKGDCVISIDGDLQHPIELLPEMINKWKNERYDIVITIRKEDDNITFFKKVSSRAFYHILNYLSNNAIAPGSADFRLLDRKVVDYIRQFHESPLFFRGIISWIGFKQCTIEYVPNQRFSGTSKYSFRKMCDLARSGIMNSSIKPLTISVWIGITFSLLSFLYGTYAVMQKVIFNKIIITGWTSLMALISFIGGLQLIIMGIIGHYLGQHIIDAKRRPPYIIQEKSDE
jgi:dolichol-phosphate mannosyltransferase